MRALARGEALVDRQRIAFDHVEAAGSSFGQFG
jgi:hypothetical protein